MTHYQHRGQRQQMQQMCTVCSVFRSMGKGQYRSSYDREMYLNHLQTAHGVRLAADQPKGEEPEE